MQQKTTVEIVSSFCALRRELSERNTPGTLSLRLDVETRIGEGADPVLKFTVGAGTYLNATERVEVKGYEWEEVCNEVRRRLWREESLKRITPPLSTIEAVKDSKFAEVGEVVPPPPQTPPDDDEMPF